MHRIAAAVLALISLAGTGNAGAQSQKASKRLMSRPRPPLSQLRFSPDGHYVLAQDDSGVTVLTVQPFAVLFRIPANDAGPAQFTPDSRQVVFVSSAAALRLASTSTPHLERWSIADHTRVAFTEIRLHGCATQELSPDGSVLACVDSSGTLRFVDIPSGETVFQKEHFGKEFELATGLRDRQNFGDLGSASVDFSPDGGFVVALPRNARGSAIAWDVNERREVKLEGAMKELSTLLGPETELTGPELYSANFAFVAPDRLIVSPMSAEFYREGRSAVAATLVAFPSGKVLSKLRLPLGPLFRATDPGFVLIRPFGERKQVDDPRRRAAAAEFRTGQVIVSEAPALDVFGTQYVAERTNGEVGLYERGKGLQATVALPGR